MQNIDVTQYVTAGTNTFTADTTTATNAVNDDCRVPDDDVYLEVQFTLSYTVYQMDRRMFGGYGRGHGSHSWHVPHRGKALKERRKHGFKWKPP